LVNFSIRINENKENMVDILKKNNDEVIESVPETYQRYLDVIYNISKTKKGGWVTNREIANRLNVEPASVSGILHKLSNLGYIKWKPKKSIRLANKGKEVALYLNETQLLLELFFEKVLKIKDKEVISKVSCDIEHHITKEIKKSLQQFLIKSGVYKGL
jgi:DtxR family Mn-dependent transcriptional regulator